MALYHAARGTKQGRPGYLLWSILDGRATLRVPWQDLLKDGKNHSPTLEMVRVALIEFERDLAEYRGHGSDRVPALPTPNARMVELDTEEFYVDLARRLEEYKRTEQAQRSAEGAREVARKFEERKP